MFFFHLFLFLFKQIITKKKKITKNVIYSTLKWFVINDFLSYNLLSCTGDNVFKAFLIIQMTVGMCVSECFFLNFIFILLKNIFFRDVNTNEFHFGYDV